MTREDPRPEPLALLDPVALGELLAAFEPLRSHPGLALFDGAGAFVAGEPDWPEAALEAMRGALATGADVPAGGAPFQVVALRTRGEVAGALVAEAGIDGAVLGPLHRSLTVLVGQAIELRDAASERLADRRRADIFYRLGETIGATLDLDQIAGPLTLVAQRATAAVAGVLLLYPSDDATELAVQASVGDPARVNELVASARQEGLAPARGEGAAAATATRAPATGPILAAAVRSRDLTLGLLVLGRPPGAAPFGDAEERLIGALAAGVGIEKARYHQRELQRQRQEQELAIGRRIQLSLLPRAAPQIAGWEFHATYRAAREVGGDFYDFIRLPNDPDALGITIGDVTGKGVPAALMMATTRVLLRSGATGGASPGEVIAQANRQIVDDNRSGLFATVLQARIGLADGRITLASAGHEPPILVRATNGRVRRLPAGGPLIGLFRSVTPAEATAVLGEGDVLVLYTDGVTDARGRGRGLFGERRLLAAIRAAKGGSADDVGAAIVAAVDAFSAGAPQFDDLTLVVVRRTGGEGKVSDDGNSLDRAPPRPAAGGRRSPGPG